MTIRLDNSNSSEEQFQPDILASLSNLLALEDPIAFLNKYKEAIELNRQIQREKAEAEAEAHRIAKAKLEAEACQWLIAKIIEYAKSQGINPYDLPYLKRKSYDELCAYIKESWPMLIPQI